MIPVAPPPAVAVSPFRDGCSCRVWAIDGWNGAWRGNIVNGRVMNVANDIYVLGYGGVFAPGDLDLVVGEIVRRCRSSVTTALPCIVYGEFPNGEVVPDHMYLEYNGYIYDTVPGDPLLRRLATSKSRLCPGCVYRNNPNYTYPEAWIGRYATFLTTAHLNVLNNAVWTWDAGNRAECYMPP